MKGTDAIVNCRLQKCLVQSPNWQTYSIWPLSVGKLRDWPPGAAFNKNLHQEGVVKKFFSLHKKCF